MESPWVAAAWERAAELRARAAQLEDQARALEAQAAVVERGYDDYQAGAVMVTWLCCRRTVYATNPDRGCLRCRKN